MRCKNLRKFNKLNLNPQRDLLFLKIIAGVLSLYVAFSCTYFSAAAQTVRDDVVRLHILANSDSEEDQQVKLLVRDALLKADTRLLSSGVNKENAREYFEEAEAELLSVAKSTLVENGYSYPVEIILENEYYETRKYGSATFPAGEYLSLKVILGEGEGKNWWCVMFPPLCLPGASDIIFDSDKSENYLTSSGDKIVNSDDEYVASFWLLELFEDLKAKF